MKYNRVLICVHGLTRNRHDFDRLAKNFCESAQAPYDKIFLIDVVGRGDSDHLVNKMEYSYPTYCADLASFIGAVTRNGEEVDWLGTSMGGLIGFFLCATPNCPIRKLVLNDVGPFISRESLLLIAQYAGVPPPVFSNFEDALENIITRCKNFGLSDEDWKYLAPYSFKKVGDKWEWHYDPNIGISFSDQSKIQNMDFWPLWDLIKAKVYVTRGKESILLTKETLTEMGKRGPGLAGFVEFDGVGHAPGLIHEDQIKHVRKFLFEN